jgi:putative nucleotidyltransferase with HDIG domain
MKKTRNGKATTHKKNRFDKDTLIRVTTLILFAAILDISILWGRSFSFETAAGTFLLIALLLIILFKDMMRYKPSIKQDYTLIFLIIILLSGNFIIGRTFYYVLEGFTRWLGTIDPSLLIYAIPLATGSMLAALLIDIHTAILFTVITSLIAGIWLNNPLYSIFSFASGLTAAFSVIRCKRRSAIWRAGLFVGLVCLITSVIISLLKGQLLTSATLISMSAAFLNGIIVATLVSALLPLFEHFFKLTTDISLLELLDLNHSLMKELLVEAPGTYHHSIVVGNLVESAAEAVGVNPLLARASAYYHDIGKIKMPEYFIENQVGPVSMHDKLTPHMSSLILVAHIKEGVELAKQHKLPQSIIDIIQQHHGTSVQTYFYERAKEQHDKTAPPVAAEDFRYPGPKPQTRIAALVLMADAIEAASRVLVNPTPTRVSALVEKLINHSFIDGQLDNCELTLKDIREIKTYFVFILSSMYHRRVDYPGLEIKDENTHKEPTKTQTS